MKRIRRIASFLLAMAMVFGLTATTLAAEITEPGQEGTGAADAGFASHTYTAYQILTGTLSEKDGKDYLVDIEWGDGIDHGADGAANPFLGALKADSSFDVQGANIFAEATDAEGVANALNDHASEDDRLARAFARVANEHKTGGGKAVKEGDKLDPGYYLVVDSTALGEGDAYNFALLQVVDGNGVTIKTKYGVPEVDKSVKATADTGSEPGEAVDVSIGDEVTFTLKGTLPDNYDYYEKYKYVFTDTLSAGLDYQGGAVVKLYADEAAFKADTTGGGGTPLTCTFDEKRPDADGPTTLTWTFADLKELEGVTITKSSVIAVTYKAKLNSKANIGSAGNPNEVTLTFSNDPNQTGEGEWEPTTSETPPDRVLVFTYGMDGTKIEKKEDGNTQEKPLAGAKFILYRGKDGEALEKDDDENPTNAQYAKVTDGRLSGWTLEKGEATVLESGVDGKFMVEGLDAGDYYLEETDAPAGYNKLKKPIEVKVRATFNKEGETPGLNTLEITVDGENMTEGNDNAAATGMVSLKVENSAGVLLPSTGGMGTTLFYVAGAALVLAAGALLVMKRRTGEGE